MFSEPSPELLGSWVISGYKSSYVIYPREISLLDLPFHGDVGQNQQHRDPSPQMSSKFSNKDPLSNLDVLILFQSSQLVLLTLARNNAPKKNFIVRYKNIKATMQNKSKKADCIILRATK